MSRADIEYAPTFTIKPRIREEDEGNRLIFECELNSLPRPEFVWYKDEELLEDDGYRWMFGLRETKPHHYLCWLELNDVIEIDEGNYRILAKNTMGEVTASIRLNFDRKFGDINIIKVLELSRFNLSRRVIFWIYSSYS